MPLGKILTRVVAEHVKLGLLTPAQQATLAARPDSLSGAALDCFLEADFKVDLVQGRVAWARAVGLSFCDVTRQRVTVHTFELIPENFCEENFVLPVGQVGETLLVAFANPFEIPLPEKIALMTGRRVARLLAHEKDLRHVFARFRARGSGHAAPAPAQSWSGVTLPQLAAPQLADLAEQANRTLAAELAIRKWARTETLEAAYRNWQERRAGDQSQASSLLGILTQELKGLDEHAVLLQKMEADGIGLVDLRTCVVPAEIIPQLDLEVCRATWAVPFGRVGKFTFMATAYALSSAVRTFWEERLGGMVLWYGATLAGLADFLANCAAARAPASAATDSAHNLNRFDDAVMPIGAEHFPPVEGSPLGVQVDQDLGEGLVERGLVTASDLAVARELSRSATGGGAVLHALVDDMKVLREEEVLRHIAQQDDVATIDPRQVGELEAVPGTPDWRVCVATQTVPLGQKDGQVLIATACYLSDANLAYWTNLFGGRIRWFGVTRASAEKLLLLLRRTSAAPTAPAGKPPPTNLPP